MSKTDDNMGSSEKDMVLEVWGGNWGMPSVDYRCLAVMASIYHVFIQHDNSVHAHCINLNKYMLWYHWHWPCPWILALPRLLPLALALATSARVGGGGASGRGLSGRGRGAVKNNPKF